MVESDAIERVQEGKATLDLVRLDHTLKDFVDGQGLTLARKMVGHSKDGTKVVRWVTPLSSKETVVVVQPPDLGTDVERAPNRVELVVRSGNLRAYGKGGWMPKESV